MPRRDPRFDAYIAKSPAFARPILEELREIVHAACPECEETLKWGHLAFMHHGILCMMASFKAHMSFGFWKSKLVLDDGGESADDSFGHFGKITERSQLPSRRTITKFVKRAAELNETGVKVPRPPRKAAKPARVPADLAAALKKHARARAGFAKLSPSHQREYIEWLAEAKREETRAKRLATTLEWLSAGKSRNWKYERR